MSWMLPMVNPDDIEIDGWDISNMNLADAMQRAEVLDINLQKQLVPHMMHMKPRKSMYYPDFIASNQVILLIKFFFFLKYLSIIYLNIKKKSKLYFLTFRKKEQITLFMVQNSNNWNNLEKTLQNLKLQRIWIK